MAEYITLTELRRLGWNPDTFQDIDAPTKHEKISSRSAYIDGFLPSQWVLPLVSWGDDIKRCCAILASIDLIRGKGTTPADREELDKEEDRQNDWLRMVAKGEVTPRVVDSTPSATTGNTTRASRVISSSTRGLSVRGTGLLRGPFQGD